MTVLGGDLTQTGDDFFPAGDLVAGRFVAVASGNCDQLSIRNRSTSSFTSLRLALYSDDGGSPFKPLSLLGSTAGTITDTSAGIKSLALSPTVALTSGTPYWIAVLVVGGTWNTHVVTGGTYRGYTAASFPGTWADTPGTISDPNAITMLAEEISAGGSAVGRNRSRPVLLT
jgi:hypothetical protein